MIRPIKDVLWVEDIDDAPQYSAIHYIGDLDLPMRKGKVFRVGPQVKEVKEGDIVCHTKWQGMETEIEGRTFMVMREPDVGAVME